MFIFIPKNQLVSERGEVGGRERERERGGGGGGERERDSINLFKELCINPTTFLSSIYGTLTISFH